MCATFGDDRLRGLGVAWDRISHFPIDLRRRPYNNLALQCECVMNLGKQLMTKYRSYKLSKHLRSSILSILLRIVW